MRTVSDRKDWEWNGVSEGLPSNPTPENFLCVFAMTSKMALTGLVKTERTEKTEDSHAW